MHFSEIIKVQFGKKMPYIALCFVLFFFNYCSLEYPNFLFGSQ